MEDKMYAMVLARPGQYLKYQQVPVPFPEPAKLQIRSLARGVCRTDLQVIDGECHSLNYRSCLDTKLLDR